MKTTLDCIPCIVRQALDAVRRTTADATVHERIVRDVLEQAATMDWDQWVRLIDNGYDAPGILLDDCAPAFLETYRQADLVPAKGQGNFESLSG